MIDVQKIMECRHNKMATHHTTVQIKPLVVYSKQGNEVVFTVTCTQHVTKQKSSTTILLNNYTRKFTIQYLCDVNCPITARFVLCDQSISHRIYYLPLCGIQA